MRKIKTFAEILQDKRVLKVYKKVETDKVQKLKLEVRSNKASDKCLIALTKLDNWEHLSVSHKCKIPSWECMNEMKEMFFKDDEECFQMHPKKDNYVNNNEYTLHIWRPVEGMNQVPPSILVGFRPNHLEEDLEAAKKLHESIDMPLTDTELRWFAMSATKEGQAELEEELRNDPNALISLSMKMGII